jgi:hypothetical protein
MKNSVLRPFHCELLPSFFILQNQKGARSKFQTNKKPKTHHTSHIHPHPPLSTIQSPFSLQSTQLGSIVDTALPEAEKAHIP